MAQTVLIVEDDETLADNIREYLVRNHWDAYVAYSAEEGMVELEKLRPDIVVTDYNLPGKNGLEMIAAALALDPQIKVIMMTGEGSVQVAVDAMKAGAFDYLSKPVSLQELKLLIEKAVGTVRMEKTLNVLQRKEGRGQGLATIIGESPAMRMLKDKVRQLLEAERRMKDDDLPAVLITGETGTGKELFARAVHFDGARQNGPFVEINCASLPPTLLEAELFGHERGAFTDAKDRKIGLVEAAEGGTLFLDELGEVDLSIQAKLLKLLEEKSVRRIGSVRERKVDIRIVAATNQDLESMVRAGKFRSDLFFRLRVITLSTVPLRGCGEDVLLIANHYLKQHAKRYGKGTMHFSREAEQVLLRYPWPGNVRELRNMLEQTVLLATSPEVAATQLSICSGLAFQQPADRIEFRPPAQPAMPMAPAAPALGMPGDVGMPGMANGGGSTRISDVERDLVVRMLEKTDWNVSKTAKLLGLSRDMLRYRIEKYGLSRPED